MALDNDAVFTAAKGFILVGDVDAVEPTPQQIYDYAVSGTAIPGYAEVGHTSREDLPEFGYDGGDTETKGTWQNAAFRTVVTEQAVDYVTFNLLEFNEVGWSLYYGPQTGEVAADNVFRVKTPGGETQKSVIIGIVDGDNAVALHAAKAGIRREAAISLATDDFGALPLRATFLQSDDTLKPLFAWVVAEDTTP